MLSDSKIPLTGPTQFKTILVLEHISFNDSSFLTSAITTGTSE